MIHRMILSTGFERDLHLSRQFKKVVEMATPLTNEPWDKKENQSLLEASSDIIVGWKQKTFNPQSGNEGWPVLYTHLERQIGLAEFYGSRDFKSCESADARRLAFSQVILLRHLCNNGTQDLGRWSSCCMLLQRSLELLSTSNTIDLRCSPKWSSTCWCYTGAWTQNENKRSGVSKSKNSIQRHQSIAMKNTKSRSSHFRTAS